MNVEKLAAQLAAQLALVIVEAQAQAEPEPAPVPKLYTVPESAEQMRCAESTVWQLLRSGELGSVRVGRKRLVPATAITEYLAGASA